MVYLTLAEIGEPPEKNTTDNLRDRSLQPDDCLVYRSREDLLRSNRMDLVMGEEEDRAPRFEVVEVYAKPGSEAAAFSGRGLYIKVHSTGARTALLDWTNTVASTGSPTEVEAANVMLELYRQVREYMA